MKSKIIIAMHKEYDVPNNEVYIPLHVGAAGKDTLKIFRREVARDDSGDNISEKNPNYCELTGLYWAWKNLDADVIGLVHYRRYFTMRSFWFCKFHYWQECILSPSEVNELFENYSVVVPKKRNYVIETMYSHYANTHYKKHLDAAIEIIREQCPEYEEACKKVYASKSGYMFNMVIAKREYLDQYCRWLFPILQELENRIDISDLSAFDARLYGRVSEILFNVWLEHVPKDIVKEIGTIHTDPINWNRKGKAFIAAKYFGKKYSSSF